MANTIRIMIMVGIIVVGITIGKNTHGGLKNIIEKRNAQISQMTELLK